MKKQTMKESPEEKEARVAKAKELYGKKLQQQHDAFVAKHSQSQKQKEGMSGQAT